ncbi:MAG: SUMF1/EgtB/PvdO family nonheme iron enzyme [Symploca sp. SIO2E9]|nr:SUMF1/EgtB/PvdO family nonheme iron enzyme [Symploca sp. SIO2E9]
MLLRIDENREIDTSYINCAEYQLFIDEKLKVGEYRQPPHWTTSRFAPGDANKPITGVKASDAEEFCEWLTQRYPAPGFKYRLPTLTEAQEYTAKEKQIGCWCNDGEKKAITEIEVETVQRQHWQAILHDSLDKDLARARDLVRKLVRNHARSLKKDLNGVYNCVSEGKLFFSHVLTGSFAYDFVNDLDFAINRSYELTRARYRVRRLAGNYNLNLANAMLVALGMLLLMTLILTVILTVIFLFTLYTRMIFQIWNDITIPDKTLIGISLIFSLVFFVVFSLRFFDSIYKFNQNLLTHKNNPQYTFPSTDVFVRDLTCIYDLALGLQKSPNRTFIINNNSTDIAKFKTIRSYLLLCYILWDLLSNIYEKTPSDRRILQARNLTREDCENFQLEYATKRDDTWNIYASFLLIDERREGKMPAWEGIRIVRERI